MTDHPFPPPPRVELPIAGSAARFPVRRVYCIGRNYAAHAVEMGHDPNRESPFFFQKNADNLDPSGEFPYPAQGDDIHHEVELAVALKSGGADIPEESALQHVFGYAVSLDMTRRDLQGEAKRLGRPWEIGKAFERSAPIGPITPSEKAGPLSSRRHHPGGQWNAPPGRRPRADDLEGAGDHRLPLALLPARGGRRDPDRDPCRRRPGRAGRPDRGADRGP